MKKEIVQRTRKQVYQLWIEALRSGEYKQGKIKLKSENGHCCLGVLCDLAVKDGGDWGRVTHDDCAISPQLGAFMGIGRGGEHEVLLCPLWVLNDLHKKSFAQIADVIEKQLMPAVCTEPA